MALARQSTFYLRPRTRPGYGSPGSAPSKTERRFLDFIIDGMSLYDSAVRGHDLASVLWIDPPVPNEILKAVRRLLLLDPGDLPRAAVYLFTPAPSVVTWGVAVSQLASSDEMKKLFGATSAMRIITKRVHTWNRFDPSAPFASFVRLTKRDSPHSCRNTYRAPKDPNASRPRRKRHSPRVYNW